jgi:hypothetical protein
MPLPGVIESANGALSLATSLADLARGSQGNRRAVRPVIEALRGIYFTPRGTREILRCLADGDRPDPETIRDVLLEFNDAEWRVQRFVDILDFRALERFDELSLRQRRTLEEIAYGKRNLRRDLQDTLNFALTNREPIGPKDAGVLLGRVEALNALIESLEEEFL